MEDNRLTPRKRQILYAIVDAHINNGEPVGSKFLSQDVHISCSPATIRNEMADLEDMGYLTQPHTSAGRVPSELAYRFYADSLIRQYSATRSEIDEINEKLRNKLSEMDAILEEVSHLAANFTDYTGFAFKTGSGAIRVRKYETVYISPREFLLVMMFSDDVVKAKTVHVSSPLEPEDLSRFSEALNTFLVNLTSREISMPVIMRLEAVMGPQSGIVHPTIKTIYECMNEMDTADIKIDGVNKLLRYPEYADVDNLRDIISMIEEKNTLVDTITARDEEESDNDLHIFIGRESEDGAMSKTTVIYKNVNIGGKKLSVGVIGPKRMNYTKVIGMINSLASGIDRLFNDGRSLPMLYRLDDNKED